MKISVSVFVLAFALSPALAATKAEVRAARKGPKNKQEKNLLVQQVNTFLRGQFTERKRLGRQVIAEVKALKIKHKDSSAKVVAAEREALSQRTASAKTSLNKRLAMQRKQFRSSHPGSGALINHRLEAMRSRERKRKDKARKKKKKK